MPAEALLYCRVSTKEQTQNLSLATQESHCRRYCRENGYEVAGVFIEEGESAKTADRPQLQKLLAVCTQKRREISAVIVYSVDRLARDVGDYHSISALLGRTGTCIRSVTENFDDSADGRLISGLHALLAQHDNDRRAERTVAGMKTAISRGCWVHQPPLGYRKPRDGGVSLEPDPASAPLVKQAFTLIAGGQLGQTQVLDLVTAEGLRSRRTGRSLAPQSFSRMLRNPLYKGWIRTSLGGPVRGDFAPLVDEATFDLVQATLSGRSDTSGQGRQDEQFPLRRFAVCERCGRVLTGSSSTGRSARYSYYHCQNGCKGIRSRTDDLEAQFVDRLQSIQYDASMFPLLRAVLSDLWKQERRAVQSSQRKLVETVKQLEQRKQELIEALVHRKVIDADTYDEQMERLNDELSRINSQLLDDAETDRPPADLLESAKHLLVNLAGFWTASSGNARRRIQRLVFPDGVTFDGAQLGTAKIAPVFLYLTGQESGKKPVVSPTGFALVA